MVPDNKVRKKIDAMLAASGWLVQMTITELVQIESRPLETTPTVSLAELFDSTSQARLSGVDQFELMYRFASFVPLLTRGQRTKRTNLRNRRAQCGVHFRSRSPAPSRLLKLKGTHYG